MLDTLNQGNVDQMKVLLELGQEMSAALASLSEDQKKEAMELARGFLECSRQDIQATRLLYGRQLFPLSVYHLQQAVEKATKAYALAFFAISKEDLIKIGHKSPMAFIRMLDKSWGNKFIVVLKMFYPDAKTNVSEARKIINLKKTQKELAKLPESVIQNFLDLNEKIRNALMSDKTQNQMNSQIEILLRLLKGRLPGVNTEEIMKSFRTDFSFDMVCSFGGLYVLSMVTYPHWEFTRYPDKEIKPSDYSSDLGVVQCMDGILTQVENAIQVLEKSLCTSLKSRIDMPPRSTDKKKTAKSSGTKTKH